MHHKIRSSLGGVGYASSCKKIISAWFVQTGWLYIILLTRLVRCCWKGLVGVTTWQWKSYRERLLEFDERKIMKMKTTFSRIMTEGRLAMCSLRVYRGLNLNKTNVSPAHAYKLIETDLLQRREVLPAPRDRREMIGGR